MSRVLKKSDASAVHSLSSAWAIAKDGLAAPSTAVDPGHAALQSEIDSLNLRLAEQEAQLTDLREDARTAFERGEAKGREAGRREAEAQETQRLARLEAAIEQAHQAFRQSLAGLEYLAPALAHEALSRILAPSEARSQLVTGILARQLAAVEAGSVLHVEVSASDFPDDLALEALEGTLGSLGPAVHASVSLKSGDCRIKLKLGTLDVGLDRQWGCLGALLQDMAEPAGRQA